MRHFPSGKMNHNLHGLNMLFHPCTKNLRCHRWHRQTMKGLLSAMRKTMWHPCDLRRTLLNFYIQLVGNHKGRYVVVLVLGKKDLESCLKEPSKLCGKWTMWHTRTWLHSWCENSMKTNSTLRYSLWYSEQRRTEHQTQGLWCSQCAHRSWRAQKGREKNSQQ